MASTNKLMFGVWFALFSNNTISINLFQIHEQRADQSSICVMMKLIIVTMLAFDIYSSYVYLF